MNADDVQLEMAFTSWEESCKEPHVTPDGDLRQCRRVAGHTESCASGFGTYYVTWD